MNMIFNPKSHISYLISQITNPKSQISNKISKKVVNAYFYTVKQLNYGKYPKKYPLLGVVMWQHI